MLMIDKITAIDKAKPLANAGIERLPVIKAIAIIPVVTTFEKQLNISFFS